MSKIAQSINRVVIVAVPTFFGDDKPRRCTLVDIEPVGLWLGGEAVNERLAKREGDQPAGDALPAVFFPFAQIGYLFDPAQVGARAGGAKTGKVADEAHATARGERAHSNRSKHKGSTSAR